ncbi:MAG: peptidoglycan-binding domain-containing protein [Pararhodobacter sp.]
MNRWENPMTPLMICRAPAFRPVLGLVTGAVMLLAGCQATTPDTAPDTALPDATAQRADTDMPGPSATALAHDICLATAMLPAGAPRNSDPSDDSTAPPPLEEHRFAVPCPEQMSADFLSALQRALIVRGYHEGAVSAEMDSDTRAAIRRYQRPRGLDSDILSLDAARSLGLIAIGRSAL